MPLARILEPEFMFDPVEAAEYDRMDFSATDQAFAERAAALAAPGARIVDLGCGNARIPLAITGLVPLASIFGVERSAEMLTFARRHRGAAPNGRRFHAIVADAKSLPFPDDSAGLVTSNSLIHHIPDPRRVFREVARIAGDRGAVLIRDLLRPSDEDALADLVNRTAQGWSELQSRLFADSLRSALTIDEVRAFLDECELTNVSVQQITERHWSAERLASAASGYG